MVFIEPHLTDCDCVSNRSECWRADFCSTVSILNPIFYMLRAKNNTCCGIGENSTLLSGFSLTASSTFWRLRSLFLPVCSLCYFYFWRREMAPLRLQTTCSDQVLFRKWDFQEMTCSVTCRWSWELFKASSSPTLCTRPPCALQKQLQNWGLSSMQTDL